MVAADGAAFSVKIMPGENLGARKHYPVWGAVGLWGRVVEHERGYRAEHAMIRRLVVPRRFLITSPPAYGVSGGPRVELAEVPDAAVSESLGRSYGVDVVIGGEIKVPIAGELVWKWPVAP